MADKQGGKGNKKKDRQRKCGQNLRYINEQKHDKSHVKRITRHLKIHDNDNKAKESLTYYKTRLGIRNR